MSVSAITSSLTSQIESLRAVTSTAVGTTSSVSGTQESSEAGKPQISKMSMLMSELDSLKETDPERYEEVLNEAADKLLAAAEELEDGTEKDQLTEMASRLQEAAETGDTSKLAPPKPPEGERPPAEIAAYQQVSKMVPSGAMETIKDVMDSLYESI